MRFAPQVGVCIFLIVRVWECGCMLAVTHSQRAQENAPPLENNDAIVYVGGNRGNVLMFVVPPFALVPPSVPFSVTCMPSL